MEESIEAVQRMQDYISAHLTETITLADLARASCFSPFYAHRLFVQHVGLTPADYIQRLRLSQSALRLRDESCQISFSHAAKTPPRLLPHTRQSTP